MAMNGSVLATTIKARMTSDGFDLTNATLTDKMISAIAEETINHIIALGVVNTTVVGTLIPPTAVTGAGVGKIS